MAEKRPGLTTHVLDTARGRPAAGLAVELWRLPVAGDPELVVATVLNADGRAEPPLLAEADFAAGTYELRFFVGDYFRSAGLAADPAFLDVVPVRVTLAAGEGHYHVPLLASPFGYTTYRGS